MQAAARIRGELVVEPREGVRVAHLAVGGVDEVRDLVEVAATSRDQPLPLAVCEPIEREQARVEQAQPDLVLLVGVRVDRSRLDDRAHAIAEVCRVSAGVHVQAVQDRRVEQARRAQQHLEVERLVQRKAVERHQRLVGGAAAHVRESRDAVARGAGQTVHRLQRIVGEPRQPLDLVLREERVSVGNSADNEYRLAATTTSSSGAGSGTRQARRAAVLPRGLPRTCRRRPAAPRDLAARAIPAAPASGGRPGLARHLERGGTVSLL